MSTTPFGSPSPLFPVPYGGFDLYDDLMGYGFQVPQGDPAAIAAAAGNLSTLGATLADQARNISGATQTATSGWQGSAASSFASYAGHVVSACTANGLACDSAASALHSLSRDLAHAQTVTRQAQTDRQHASSAVTSHQSAAKAAGQEANTASVQAMLLAPHPAAAADSARQAQHAQQQQADAQRAATAAQGELEAAQRRGHQAYEAYLHQAQAVSTKLQTAANDLRPAPALPGAKHATKKAAPKHHHSFLGVALPLLATAGLTALDIAQLGLDPVTDAATVAAGAETVAAIGGEAAETAVVADAGAAATAEEGTSIAEEFGPGIDRGDGRDILGRFTGEGGYGANAEIKALDAVEKDLGTAVIRKQVNVKLPDDVQVSGANSVRRYDGLVKHTDGTYEGIEVKSGSSRDLAQEKFDLAVNKGTPATGMLDGKPITITSVRMIRTAP